MPSVPRKAPFRCPQCGFIQDEPEHLISTYCRSCGSHYEVTRSSPKRRLSDRFRRARDPIWRARVFVLPARKIRCHRCGKAHDSLRPCQERLSVPPVMRRSISVMSQFPPITSRPIDIRGDLFITPSGYVCSALTVCRAASIAGRIGGTLICEDTLCLSCSERLCCQMNASIGNH